MGNAASIEKALEGEAKKLAKTSGFTAGQMQTLKHRFSVICNPVRATTLYF